MTILLLIVGFLILGAILADIFKTTLTTRGAGFLTSWIMESMWRGALALHRRRPAPQVVTRMGPLITAIIVLTWVLCIWAGRSFVFNAGPMAVVDTETGQPANVWSRIYYAGFTLFTLGIGDYRPHGAPWQILTALCVANGLLTITMSVTYLVPVVSAASTKRQLAACISSPGLRPAEIVANGWDCVSFDRLMGQLGSLSTLISQQAQEHLAYPVLHYFHSAEDETALAPRIAALDEALRILRHAVAAEARPAQIDLLPLTEAITVYMEALGSAHISPVRDEPPIPPLALLEERGIPLAEHRDIEAAFRGEVRRRRMLLALVRHDGWEWPHG